MKGNDKVIEQLNARLAEELAAINQYFLHAEMCENWRYEPLKGEIKKRSIQEMRHAEKLIERILFLEGRPVVNKLGKISIGDSVEKMHKNDWAAENDAIQKYNESIRIAIERATTAPRSCSRRSSRTRRNTSTGSRRSRIRSSRWASRSTWESRSADCLASARNSKGEGCGLPLFP